MGPSAWIREALLDCLRGAGYACNHAWKSRAVGHSCGFVDTGKLWGMIKRPFSILNVGDAISKIWSVNIFCDLHIDEFTAGVGKAGLSAEQ